MVGQVTDEGDEKDDGDRLMSACADAVSARLPNPSGDTEDVPIAFSDHLSGASTTAVDYRDRLFRGVGPST